MPKTPQQSNKELLEWRRDVLNLVPVTLWVTPTERDQLNRDYPKPIRTEQPLDYPKPASEGK